MKAFWRRLVARSPCQFSVRCVLISEISKKDSEVEVNDNESLDKEDEYYYYYSNLTEDYDKATTEEAQKDAVISNLPSVDNNNYMLIINRIKAEIHKEYLELESLKSDDESLSFILLIINI